MNKKVFLVVMAGLLCSKGLLAEEAAKSYTSGEVVVTSSRVEESKKNVTTNVTVISKEEIRQSSAQDLGSLLAEKNIGYIHKYPGTLTTIGIRGFRTDTHGNDLRSKVLVLLNGRRAGTGNLAKISTGNIERIEILRGPAAVQYGSAAIGGVVNVITAKGSGHPGLFLEQTIGSNEYTQTTLGATGKTGNFDFSGRVSFSEMGDYKTGSERVYRNAGYDDLTAGSVNVGYEFMPGHRVGVIYSYFKVGHEGMPNYLNQNDLDDYGVKKNYSTDFIYEGATPDKSFSWMARFFTGRDEDLSFDPAASNPDGWDDGGAPFRARTDNKGAQAQVTYNHDVFRATAGVDWVKYDEHRTLYAPFLSGYDNLGYFLMLNGYLMDRTLVLSAGFRHDSYDLMYQRFAASPEQKQDDGNFSKSFGIAWHAMENLKFRASYAEGFMMPSAEQLAADFISFGRHYIGNADLKPEESKTYEVGVDLDYQGLAASLTWFTTDFKNKIQPTSIGTTSSWINLGGATISGMEADLSKSFDALGGGWILSPYFNMVYLTEYEDDTTHERLLYTPEWNATVGVRVHDQRGFSAMFNLSYVGETRIEDWETSWTPPIITKGGFTVANLSASKKFLFDGDRQNGRGLTVTGEVNNLFDRDYQYVKGYPMPGRTFMVGLRVDI